MLTLRVLEMAIYSRRWSPYVLSLKLFAFHLHIETQLELLQVHVRSRPMAFPDGVSDEPMLRMGSSRQGQCHRRSVQCSVAITHKLVSSTSSFLLFISGNLARLTHVNG